MIKFLHCDDTIVVVAKFVNGVQLCVYKCMFRLYLFRQIACILDSKMCVNRVRTIK